MANDKVKSVGDAYEAMYRVALGLPELVPFPAGIAERHHEVKVWMDRMGYTTPDPMLATVVLATAGFNGAAKAAPLPKPPDLSEQDQFWRKVPAGSSAQIRWRGGKLIGVTFLGVDDTRKPAMAKVRFASGDEREYPTSRLTYLRGPDANA